MRVLENPIIKRIMFKENNAVTTERLEEETEAEPRQTFTLSRVEQDVQRILEVYRRSGRFAATVTPQYKVLEQNRADLIFVIEKPDHGAVSAQSTSSATRHMPTIVCAARSLRASRAGGGSSSAPTTTTRARSNSTARS